MEGYDLGENKWNDVSGNLILVLRYHFPAATLYTINCYLVLLILLSVPFSVLPQDDEEGGYVSINS